MSCKHETEWCKNHAHCETCGHYELDNLTATSSMIKDGAAFIRIPKTVARITLCGAVSFNIDDTMSFIKPAQEQIKNLKETFCIDVELFN